jgi:DNA-binding transcriptional LysR family regulator
LESVGDAIAAVATSEGPVRGRIHVVAPTSFAMHRLVPLLPSLLVAHPQLQVALDLHAMPARLIAEEIDLAFRTGPIDAHSLVARKIGEESLVLVASPAYLDRHGRPTEPAQLADHPFLDARSEGEGELRLAGAGGPVRVRCKSTLRSTDPLPLVELAEGGCGIARIPRDLAEDSLAAGRLEIVLPELPHEPLVMFALYRPGRNDDPRVRAVLDAVLDAQKRRPSSPVHAGEALEPIPSAPVSGIRCLTPMQAAR